MTIFNIVLVVASLMYCSIFFPFSQASNSKQILSMLGFTVAVALGFWGLSQLSIVEMLSVLIVAAIILVYQIYKTYEVKEALK